MSDLLHVAKAHQKKREWKEAVHSFEKYIKESNGDFSVDVYVSYAKCTSQLGDINHAIEILQKGKAAHPESARILKELFHLFSSINEKDNAKTVAQSLVDLNPEKSSNYFLLGKAYAALNRTEEAKINYITGLEHKHGLAIEVLIEKIQDGFADTPEEVSSEYIFISGRSNYGSFIHNYKGKKYLTKISDNSIRGKREDTFYKALCEDFPVLKEHVPAYMDSIVIDNILYLTLEMIENVPVISEHITDVLAASQKISSIPYEDLVTKYPNLNYSFQMKNKPNPMTVFFTQIHQRYYNERLIAQLYKLMKQNNYPDSARSVVQSLESFIVNNELYLFLKPELHYSLVHGDYNQSNSKIATEDQKVKVFDWETFKIGPHFMDIARYLSGAHIPYSDVKEIYLDNDCFDQKLSSIEKIFFLYALILLYMLTFREKKIGNKLDVYITPALNDLESLVDEFTKTDYYFNVKSLMNEKEKQDTSGIAKLDEKISSLHKGETKPEGHGGNVFYSKFERFTAPIRKLLKRKDNR